jgi:hypothetical protein
MESSKLVNNNKGGGKENSNENSWLNTANLNPEWMDVNLNNKSNTNGWKHCV